MDWAEKLDKWAADYLPDLTIKVDEAMSRHTSFRIGGPARRMAFPGAGSRWCRWRILQANAVLGRW